MALGLLASEGVLTGVVIAAFAVLCALCIVYGVLRKFYRTTWLGWQIALIFPCTLVLQMFAEELEGIGGFAIAVGVFLAWAAAVLGGGALFRYFLLRRARPAHLFFRVMNRILGGLTALVNLAVFGAVFGGVSLLFLQFCLPALGGYFEPVYSSGVWEYFGAHAFDLFLVAMLALAVRGGYRVGLGRSVFATIMLILTLGCVLLALYFPVGVRFSGKALVPLMAATMKRISPVLAFFLSYLICAILVFLVSFAIVILLGLGMNYCVRKCRAVAGLGIVDGVLLALISYVFAVALWCGIFAGVGFLAGDGFASLGGAAGEALAGVSGRISEIFLGVEEMFLSSPFSALLYLLSPIPLP